jgi:hypothetical protein
MLYRMHFQKIVLIIAIVILIIMLVIIGVTLSKSRTKNNWPPIVGECPDYWVDMSGNGEACFNSNSLGRCNIPGNTNNNNTMNFNQSPFTGNDGNCAKYRWATSCGITWDGITSGVKNPCDSSSSSS